MGVSSVKGCPWECHGMRKAAVLWRCHGGHFHGNVNESFFTTLPSPMQLKPMAVLWNPIKAQHDMPLSFMAALWQC